MSVVTTPLLAGVDPYEDTVFNRIQVTQQLPAEVEFLRQRVGDYWQPTLDELQRLMDVTTARVHRYLWFVGD